MSVTLTNVTKYFGKVKAVSSLNFKIGDGECFSMLGPSGCGKTTTLRMVAGFEDLDEGEISVNDVLLSSSGKKYYLPPEKRNFGMVFQAFAVWPHMSVFENVAFPLRLKKINASEIARRTTQALEHTSLLDVASKSPADLSGGGKQRVALARALAINPSVMLLDEPLSSLDPHLREEMRFEIKELQKIYGFSIMYVTHDQSEAMALSDRILIMKNGVVQQIASPLEVYTKPANRFVFSFIGLSNFTNMNVTENAMTLDGVSVPFVEGRAPSGEIISAGVGTVASRPNEIDFVDHGGIPGTVMRRTFLGEVTDYQILVGDQEVRVQKGRYVSGPQEGETCHLRFLNPLWFPVEK
ncbi:ABC transporter ATP-binding protein [Desulfovibrio sp.]|uniref:ABC transporter ATP-binding protein n=1 Tax=Desulfovibrio sp. TaxID=885 RepID=UPI003D0D880B